MGWMMECAAEGCERRIDDDTGMALERISPVPGPFVGLCQNHIGKTVVLKKGAQEVLSRNQEVS